MLSISKIVLLAGVVGAVLFAGKFLRGLKKASEQSTKVKEERRDSIAVDLVKCRVCDSYVDASAGPCERPDCPRKA